jgi:predicted cobalt transporter CbtA
MHKVQVRVLRGVRRTPVGGILTVTKREADVLVAMGRVERIVEAPVYVAPEPVVERAVVEPEPAPESEADEEAEEAPRPRRQYQRRDMTATTTAATKAPAKRATRSTKKD